MDKLVLVDGHKIRMFQDLECPTIARRQPDPRYYDVRVYIPEGEVWLDYPYQDEAEELLAWEDEIKVLGGAAYLARRAAKVKELVDAREKAGIKLEDLKIKQEPTTNAILVHVNGRLVRKYFDPDFIFGGHHYVYSYIPVDEVWVDNAVVPAEKPFVLLHENHERELMKNGAVYEDGHASAKAVEEIARRAAGAIYPGDAGYDSSISLADLYQKFLYQL